MKKQLIPEWDGITDYRSPVFEAYEFDFSAGCDHSNGRVVPNTPFGDNLAALNYSREIVNDPNNNKWIERRKLVDAFKMGIEYAKRFCANE